MKAPSATSVVSLAALVLLAACTNRASKLPDYGVVPPFEMTDSAGEPFNSLALADKAWVVDFIYTSCPAECPLMTSKMHSIEKQVRSDGDIRLVSISVDPDRDTPEVLNNFAKRYGGPTKQWTFLTGSPQTIHQVAFTTFHVGDVIGKISHSTKFVLVDKRGHIRGYYSTLEADGIPDMMRDLAALSTQAP